LKNALLCSVASELLTKLLPRSQHCAAHSVALGAFGAAAAAAAAAAAVVVVVVAVVVVAAVVAAVAAAVAADVAVPDGRLYGGCLLAADRSPLLRAALAHGLWVVVVV